MHQKQWSKAKSFKYDNYVEGNKDSEVAPSPVYLLSEHIVEEPDEVAQFKEDKNQNYIPSLFIKLSCHLERGILLLVGK